MSTRNYEAMFILDTSAPAADFEAVSAQVDAILEKHGATIVQKEKWDERKLAYEIKGQRRGTYYLTYFSALPASIRKINEDVQLSETILRHLVLTIDGPIDEHVAQQAVERERLAEDSRKNAIGGWGGAGGGGRRGDRRGGSRRDDDDPDDELASSYEAEPVRRSPSRRSDRDRAPTEAATES